MAEKETVEEELDYRITFPSPVGKDYSDDEGEAAEGDGQEPLEPVVILLGWLGCQEKHLAKYAAIWERKRYHLCAVKSLLHLHRPSSKGSPTF